MEHMLSARELLGSQADSITDGYNILDVKLVPDIREQDWARTMTKFGILWQKDQERLRSMQLTFSNLEVRVLVRRDPYFFITKVVFVTFVLTLMAPATFLFDRDAIGDRSSVSVGLVFTGLAFQFTINQYLPILPYTTALDRLIFDMYLFYAFAYFENISVFF